MIQRRLGWMWCGQMMLFGINSTHHVWRQRNAEPQTTISMSNMVVKTFCFDAFSLLRVQEDFTALRDQWTGPCTVESWMITLKIGCGWGFSMRMTQKIWPRQLKSHSVRSALRSLSDLVSLQTIIPWKICGASTNFKLPRDSLETFGIWRVSVKRSGTKSLLRCMQTLWTTTRKGPPLCLPTMVSPKVLSHVLLEDQILIALSQIQINLYLMFFLDFFFNIVSRC